jgi:hypothetical protein
MCIVSLAKKVLNIAICNLHPDLELTSPICCSNGATCCVSSSQQIGTGNTMEASFGVGPVQNYFKGALLYKLQRKHAERTGNRPNSSTVSIVDTATDIYLLVVWDIVLKEYGFYVRLIECVNDFSWDEDKLWTLHREYNDQFRKNCIYNIITRTDEN